MAGRDSSFAPTAFCLTPNGPLQLYVRDEEGPPRDAVLRFRCLGPPGASFVCRYRSIMTKFMYTNARVRLENEGTPWRFPLESSDCPTWASPRCSLHSPKRADSPPTTRSPRSTPTWVSLTFPTTVSRRSPTSCTRAASCPPRLSSSTSRAWSRVPPPRAPAWEISSSPTSASATPSARWSATSRIRTSCARSTTPARSSTRRATPRPS